MAGIEGSAILLAEGAAAWAKIGTYLVFGDAAGWAERWLDAGADLVAWRRRAFGGPCSELPGGPFDGAILDVPASRDELRMNVELAAARVRPGGMLLIHGGNAEGIKSVGDKVGPWWGVAETLDARRHARVWRSWRETAEARPDLDAFAERRVVHAFGAPKSWVTWPGCFAGGDLDPGTAQLLAEAPAIEGAALDLACGIGVIGAGVRRQGGTLAGCDVDALSVRAASQNAPYDHLWVGEGLAALPTGARFDLVLSNPPVHRGVREDVSVLRAIVEELPAVVDPGGTIRVVVQRHRAFARWLADGWREVRVVSQSSGYQVLEGRR